LIKKELEDHVDGMKRMSSASTSLLRRIELDVDGSAEQPVPNLTLGCVLAAKLKHGLHLGIS
jgi:hypothetical protein